MNSHSVRQELSMFHWREKEGSGKERGAIARALFISSVQLAQLESQTGLAGGL